MGRHKSIRRTDFTGFDSGRGDIFIYALVNPIDGNIFYIGRTQKTLAERLKEHLRGGGNNRRLREILEYIDFFGGTPEIQLLETTRYLQREIEVIKEYSKKYNLANTICV
jgi:hypothetical protein